MGFDLGRPSSAKSQKRLCSVASGKATFALITGFAVFVIAILTFFTSFKELSHKLAYNNVSILTEYRQLEILETSWSNDSSNEDVRHPRGLTESLGIESKTSFRLSSTLQLKNVSETSTIFVTSASNLELIHSDTSTSLTPIQTHAPIGVQPLKTTMTFNGSFDVTCVESPFVICTPPVVKVTTDKVFKVAFLRPPRWYSLKALQFSGCPYKQCQAVKISDKPDLVVVYGVHLRDSFQPPQRLSHQLYAVVMWESPIYAHADFHNNANSVWNSRINLTLTYRVDSDIFSPYGQLHFRPRPVDKRPNYLEIAKKKTKTAVWIVSHCKTHSKRENYVKEMQKYVDVDIFGSCGEPCSKTDTVCNNVASTYKFYLSFENSLCTDYITEKFFKIFTPETHIIPVARGGAKYDNYFPNFIFINAANFKTAKDLALHLKNLASDLETYSKYLEYKDLYVQKRVLEIPCSSCEYLHTRNVSGSKTYNLKSWGADGHCHSPNDF